MIKIIKWKNNQVIMIDQRKLPGQVKVVTCSDYRQVIRAIKTMVIRGAPAIGIAAAMGAALGAKKIKTPNLDDFKLRFNKICQEINRSRPTAVNLFWAVQRMRNLVEKNPIQKIEALKKTLIQEACRMLSEDIANNKRLGFIGQKVISKRATVLTHCNTGALATGGYGTALGVIRAAKEAGKQIQVIANETRPCLQGARLTAWEMVKEHIPVTLITDNMGGDLMKKGFIDVVIVGADRIAANGDIANKIGTYSLAVLAREHGIPFYVAASCSTIDLQTKTGEDIPIEERDEKEVTIVGGERIAPLGIKVLNPAFDVTPHAYLTGIITEKGILKAPYRRSIEKVLKNR